MVSLDCNQYVYIYAGPERSILSPFNSVLSEPGRIGTLCQNGQEMQNSSPNSMRRQEKKKSDKGTRH